MRKYNTLLKFLNSNLTFRTCLIHISIRTSETKKTWHAESVLQLLKRNHLRKGTTSLALVIAAVIKNMCITNAWNTGWKRKLRSSSPTPPWWSPGRNSSAKSVRSSYQKRCWSGRKSWNLWIWHDQTDPISFLRVLQKLPRPMKRVCIYWSLRRTTQ